MALSCISSWQQRSSLASWKKKFHRAAVLGGDPAEEKIAELLAELDTSSDAIKAGAIQICRDALSASDQRGSDQLVGVSVAAFLTTRQDIVSAGDGAWLAVAIVNWTQKGCHEHAEAIVVAFISRGDVAEPQLAPLFHEVVKEALKVGATSAVDMLLRKSAFVHMRIHSNELAAACKRADGGDTLRWLLALPPANQPDVNDDGGRVLRLVCKEGRADFLQMLLAVPAPQGPRVAALQGAAQFAAELGAVECLAQLLALEGDRCVDVNATEGSIWLHACRAPRNALECVQLLLSLPASRGLDVHARGDAALSWAVEGKDMNVLRLLLSLQGEQALDVHANDEHAYTTALALGYIAPARELLLSFSAPRASAIGAREPGAALRNAMECAIKRRLFPTDSGSWLAAQLAGELVCCRHMTRCGQPLQPLILVAIRSMPPMWQRKLQRSAGHLLWNAHNPHGRPARRAMLLHREAASAPAV